ncbi:ABC transporter permease [Frigoriglobus tundricola]|uniref:ABC transporter permease n=1 Tax=Frigoriglobus tundricola TaxID=2774151 RepID=UPI00148EAC30|nr:ABC transporter permease subunit [Frigoriglobus tundricola]
MLVVQSFQRHWRVRQMGWVSLGLLGIVVAWVAVFTARGGWDLTNQRARRAAGTNRQEAERLRPASRYAALGDEGPALPLRPHEVPSPLNPTEDALQSLVLSVPHAAMTSDRFLADWAFMTYSRWVVHFVFMGFVLPLFTLSYASGAFGTDRESRSLVWLMTRPIPRSAIYLAKFLGTLPWCLAFGLGGFVAVCLAGGPVGHEALARYWPAATVATLAFAALFHLVGALFQRPVVVGLVYVFFFEAVVAALPGSLKLLSLTFYARSLMYNEAAAAGYPVDMLPSMAAAVSSTTAWAVLGGATVAITLAGMWFFARSEYRDDV